MNIVIALAAGAVAAGLLSGCHVSEQKNGENKNVSIGTPFGSMQVKTNEKGDTSGIGISVYPGATPLKENSDKDGGSADVNMSFGDFHLGVRAATFSTPDAQDKVLAFYKNDLARYGTVIECRGNESVGEPSRTAQGLTCANDTHSNPSHTLNLHTHSDDLELRTGSDARQHIVGVSPRDGGTKIGLVLLDLPTHLGGHGKDEVE